MRRCNPGAWLLTAVVLAGLPAAGARASKEAPPWPPVAPTFQTATATAADQQLEQRLRELQARVGALKEEVRRSRARLALMEEAALGGTDPASARVVLRHRNRLGRSLVLESVTYLVDGAPVYTRLTPDPRLGKDGAVEIFDARLAPGAHQLTVRMRLRGSGFGLFSYAEGYRVNVQQTHAFTAGGGRVTEIETVAHAEGSRFTTALTDRAGLRFEQESRLEAPREATAAARASSAGGERRP